MAGPSRETSIPNPGQVLSAYLAQFRTHAFLLACRTDLLGVLTRSGECTCATLALESGLAQELLPDLLDVLCLDGLVEKRVAETSEGRQVLYKCSPVGSFYLGGEPDKRMTGLDVMNTETWSGLIAQAETV